MRAFARILAALCVLLSIAGLGAQTSPVEAPLVFTIEMQDGAPRVHLALRNRSNAPVHVLLGVRDNLGEDLDAFSFLFVDAGGQRVPVVLIGHAVQGNIGPVHEVIAPGKGWQTDMKLSEFMIFKDPANPSPFDRLPAGSYTVYGIFKGDSTNWPPHSSPYWVGTVQSAPVRYAISK
jgi:hypothetical protein